MHFTVALLLVAFALSRVTLPAKSDIVAFSGSTCNGAEGANVACNDGCVNFQNRHSFAVLASGTHCVTVYEDTKCTVNVGSIQNKGGGACSNVNTGTNVQSFKCGPNSVCPTIAEGNSTIPESE